MINNRANERKQFENDFEGYNYTPSDVEIEWAFYLVGQYGFDPFDPEEKATLKEEEGAYALAIIERIMDDYFVHLGRRKESDPQRLFWDSGESFKTYCAAETFADCVACTVVVNFGNGCIG